MKSKRFSSRLNFILKHLLLILVDAAIISAAAYAAFYLRFDGKIPLAYFRAYWQTIFFYTGVHIVAMIIFRVYNNLWRYATLKEYMRLAFASVFGSTAGILLTFFIGQPYPRSVYIISWLLIVAGTVAVRLFYRLRQDGAAGLSENFPQRSRKVVFYGAGNAGAMVARELQRKKKALDFYPLGFIDDDPSKWGLRICGLKVLGGKKRLYSMVNAGRIDEVTITMPSAPRNILREITSVCRTGGVTVKTMPFLHELINGEMSLSRLRDIRIEDLLGREPVITEMDNVSAYITGKTVLITGGGGSIGAELCRQVANQKPSMIVVLDHNENAVYEINRELEYRYPAVEIQPVVADIRNRARVESAFARFSPHVVFHAAAHKHVPLMEDNIEEAIENNIFGTRILAEAADLHRCSRFVLISTDKAVNPAGVMGATKRVAEMIMQYWSQNSKTHYCAVRFGNVLGSSGSVLPLFQEQISAGLPITVTHRDMARYFMTISEAVQLVLHAGSMGDGGEVFLLDMGEPIKIINLAEDVIRLSGLEPYRDIDILITSPRPGEKIFEELYHEDVELKKTMHERIYLTGNSFRSMEELQKELRLLSDILKTEPGFLIREINNIGKKAVSGK